MSDTQQIVNKAWVFAHVLRGGNGQLVSVSLDIKNPNGAESLEYQPPEKLVEDILTKERRIIDVMGKIKAVLSKA